MAGLKLLVLFISMCFLSMPANTLNCERHRPSNITGNEPIVETISCPKETLCLRVDKEAYIAAFGCELWISYLLYNI